MSPILPADPDTLLSKEDLMVYLGNIGETLFNDMVKDGRIPVASLTVGKTRFWRTGKIRLWVQDQEKKAEREALDASSESPEIPRNRPK